MSEQSKKEPKSGGLADVKTFYINKAAAEVPASNAIDPWANISVDNTLEPPYSKFSLAKLATEHGYTRGILDAIVDNTTAFGGRFVAANHVDETTEEAIEARYASENFLRNIGVGGQTLEAIRKAMATDLHQTGEAYIEVLVNARGKPIALAHIPSVQIRISPESAPVRVSRPIVEFWGEGPKVKLRPEHCRFRTYCQRVTEKVRWFKEWGDPREISAETGLEITAETAKHARATSVIRFYNYSSWTPYGVPAWAAAALENEGARGVARLNLGMIDANAIPALAVLVSGGRLTDGSLLRFQEFLESKGQAKKSMASILLIEGESGLDTDPNQVKIELKPLTDKQRDDSLFGEYVNKCDEQITAATRVPDIFVGKGTTGSGEVYEASRRLADEQVFGPLRSAFDAVFNLRLLVYYGKGYWEYESRSPSVTSSSVQASMLATLERTGGITPAIARRVAEVIFPAAAEGSEWGGELDKHTPYSLQLAKSAKREVAQGKKSTEGDKMPGEPGHFVASTVPSLNLSADGKQKA